MGLHGSCLTNNTMMVASVGVEGEVLQLLVGRAVATVLSHQCFKSPCHSQSQRYSHHWPALFN